MLFRDPYFRLEIDPENCTKHIVTLPELLCISCSGSLLFVYVLFVFKTFRYWSSCGKTRYMVRLVVEISGVPRGSHRDKVVFFLCYTGQAMWRPEKRANTPCLDKPSFHHNLRHLHKPTPTMKRRAKDEPGPQRRYRQSTQMISVNGGSGRWY
jgi:hypothetical protein